MTRLLIVIAIMVGIALLSSRQSDQKICAYDVILMVVYSLFVGLRTSYNDTPAYIKSFMNAESLSVFLQNPDNTNYLHNPLFYAINAKFHEYTTNYHLFFVAFAIFDAILLIRFLKKHALGHYSYTILLFWGFGLGMFGAAAMKQITAMAILTFAFDAVLEKKWLRFFLIVLLASLIHTYAILFIVLPLFTSHPWSWKTLLITGATGIILFTFDTTISSLLDYADAAGKSVADFEVFDGVQMNVFRVAVFGICPFLLLMFRKLLFSGNIRNTRELYLLCNMSIIAFMFMLMGSVNGANMFGRLATYFVFGDICLLGWMLKQIFEKRSYQILLLLSILLFMIFIIYDNRSIDAYGGYASISLRQFISELIWN